jgi:hypothetical protein
MLPRDHVIRPCRPTLAPSEGPSPQTLEFLLPPDLLIDFTRDASLPLHVSPNVVSWPIHHCESSSIVRFSLSLLYRPTSRSALSSGKSFLAARTMTTVRLLRSAAFVCQCGPPLVHTRLTDPPT